VFAKVILETLGICQTFLDFLNSKFMNWYFTLCTINDLYHFHPKGRDESFWRELLVEINTRLQLKPEKRALSRHILAVLNGGD